MWIQSLSAQIHFQKIYGGASTDDYGQSVVEAFDQGFFVAGVRVSTTPSIIGEGLLMRTNKYGTEKWTQYYSVPGSNDLTFDHMQPTSDGNLVVAGVVNFITSDYNAYLAKLDTLGNVIWSKNYGDNCRQRAMQVKQTSDGGYILGGWNEIQCNAPSISFHLIKTDSNGDTLWTRTYNNNGNAQTGYAVTPTPDGGYVIGGSTDLPMQIGYYPYLIKTDANGDTLWTKVLNDMYNGEVRDLFINKNGKLMVSGWIAPNNCALPALGEYDVMNGNENWVYGYNSPGFCEWAYSADTTTNGYVIFGMDNVSDFYVVRTDVNGDTIWTKKFDQDMADYGNSVHQTSDGGFILCGITTNPPNTDILLIKLDSLGNAVGTPEIELPNTAVLFPNPANDQFMISTQTNNLIEQLVIFTADGKRVLEKNIGATQTTVSVTELANGMYLVRMKTEKGIITSRLEIIR